MRPLIFLFAFLLLSRSGYGQTEGATISLSLSAEYTAPGVIYFINGSTQAGKEPVMVRLTILSPDSKEKELNIVTDSKGNFHAEQLANEPYGKYVLTVIAADGINTASKELWVLDADAIREEFEKAMAAMTDVAEEGLQEADALAGLMPPSSAKQEYAEKSGKLKSQLAENREQFSVAYRAFGEYIRAISKVPGAFSKAIPYINGIKDLQKEAAENEKNFKEKMARSKTNAAYCETLNFLVEAAGFISLYLDFESKIIGTMKNLLSDKAIPGALDRHNWGRMPGQQQEDYKLLINTAQKTAFSLTDKMDGLVKFIKTGASLDLFQYCGKAVYGKFCEELKGPFTGNFRAEFDAEGGQGLWHFYEMNMKGNLVLRYEKGGDIKKGFAVKGEFEGVFTGYSFWEDFEKVEPVPEGMTLLERERIMAKPVDVTNIPVPKVSTGNGKTTVSKESLNIYNDLGMIARQMVPGSFIIKLKGKVINNKIYLSIDKDAMASMTNMGQANQLLIVMAQPLLPVPLVKVFDFPMAPARSVFSVGIGDQQVIELLNNGDLTTGAKEINNSQTLDNGNIRVRTRLSIKIGS